MPFTFKLSQRLARSRTAVALTLVALAGCAPGDSRITGPSVDSSRNKYSAIASISVSPANATEAVGQTGQFVATAMAANGSVLTGVTFAWRSLDTSVVAVNATGFANALGAGTTTIVASAGGRQGTAAVTVTAPPPATPGTVGDLAVAASTDTSITLSFTEVSDGSGQPANYEIRLAAGAITWGSAAPVTTGTCAAPVAGTSVGAKRECTVLGLAPSSIYQLQMVAYRGVLNGSAVFGALSNVAGGTTAAAGVVPVASVIVSPSSASGTVGQAAQFTASVQDSAGNPLTGRTVTWASSDNAVVTVSTSGYATAVGPGSATLTATSEGKSGSAAVSVTGTSTAPVATVTVSPASTTVSVGGTYQFTATLRDASGNVLTGRAVTWSVSDPLVSLVDAGGLVTGLLAGSVTVTASSEGQTGTAALTVSVLSPPPPSGLWPDEPTGMTTLTDNPFDLLSAPGWSIIWNDYGYVTIGSDGAAPTSAPAVLQVMYPAGFQGGSAPGTEIFPHAAAKEVFAGFWWKASNPWQNHPGSNVNKLAFWYTVSSGQNIDIQMYGPAPYHLHVVTEFPSGSFRLTPNVTSTAVTLGTWHRIEWYVKYATSATSGDGLVKWWLDGVLQGSYANVQTPDDAGFSEFKISPTWGGIGDTKAETDYYWYDQIHLSRR
jgi:uncharacterized protein YjdB